MSNEKLKSENYTNLGGLNVKSSPYVLNQMEFLQLINFDFQEPGALNIRWGSTMYMGQTFPGQINSIFEFARLEGPSFLFASYSGGIFYGATTGSFQGLSFQLQSVSFVSEFIYTTIYPPQPNAAPSYSGILTLSNPIPYFGNLQQTVAYAAYNVNPSLQSDNVLSYAVLNNFLFAADGNKFFKFDGVTTYPIGLPPVLRPSISILQNTFVGSFTGLGVANGGNVIGEGSSLYFSSLNDGVNFLGLGMTGSYIFYMSYLNQRGFEGPIWPLFNAPGCQWTVGASAGAFLCAKVPISTPLAWGITSINTYCYYSPTSLTQTIGDQAFDPNDKSLWSAYPYVLVSNTKVSGSTITYITLGSTPGGATGFFNNNLGPLPSVQTQSYQTLGLTAYFNTTSYPVNFSYGQQITNFLQPQYFPRFIETYQNRLFLAGFSSSPSTVWFSDAGEPEGYAPSFNFQVRTNDGDFITCLKSYSTRLYIFKQKSFHILTGDNPNDFFLQEVTDQYGCLNNRCAVVYDDILVFLDRKGVIMWNGAALTVLSQKVQSFFDQMNYNVALQTACMVHDKIRNQVLISIPYQGATQNNLILVYDYLVGAWTTYQGPTITALTQAQGYLSTKYAFYGDNLGRVNYFGPSLLGDNAQGFTAYFQSRFLHDMGESVTKQFRRLYIDIQAPSVTLSFSINFYQDYGTSQVLQTTLTLSQFQNRLDYGIPAKSLAFDFLDISTTVPLTVFGFTIESRLQRKV
jgi:hypothetical protein